MASSGPFFRRLLVVIKQTAYEEYSQVSIDVGGRLMDRRRGARLIATEIHRPRVRGVRVCGADGVELLRWWSWWRLHPIQGPCSSICGNIAGNSSLTRFKPPRDCTAQTEGTSPQGPPMDAPRISLPLPQGVRGEPPLGPPGEQCGVFVREPRGIGPAAPGGRRPDDRRRGRRDGAQRGALFGSRHDTVAGDQFGSKLGKGQVSAYLIVCRCQMA